MKPVNGNDALGIYIHIPFCDGKCPYCDFYSVSPRSGADTYVSGLPTAYYDALLKEIDGSGAAGAVINTVYFGGGTPLLMGAERLCDIMSRLGRLFDIMSGCEITVEANPRSTTLRDLIMLKRAGFSRLSIGAQSGSDAELKVLGRRHSAADISDVMKNARLAGFENISLDIMLAVPGQDKDSLAETVEFYSSLGPEHISAYILKIEPGTPFGKMAGTLDIPDDDGQAELYDEACRRLEKAGYKQYEISNFCRPGMESRHNLKYWNCEEYLGFGAAAHGFYKGKRYYHPRDIYAYIGRREVIYDGEGGGEEEYIMLRLRLSDGIIFDEWRRRFGRPLPESIIKKAKRFEEAGLTACGENGIRLTRKGFLVSNAVIADIIS